MDVRPRGSGGRVARVVVYGSGGSGKSTLAAVIAAAIEGDHVELDLLAFDERGDHVALELLAERFRARAEAERWVVEGMHRDELRLAIPEADVFVWLDPPRRTIAVRLVRRSLGHALRRDDRHGRRVSVRQDRAFIAKTVRNIERRRTHARAMATLAADHGVDVVHLRSPAAVRRFVAGLPRS